LPVVLDRRRKRNDGRDPAPEASGTGQILEERCAQGGLENSSYPRKRQAFSM